MSKYGIVGDKITQIKSADLTGKFGSAKKINK